MHKVSIIIASYNPSLEKMLFSINSVIKQTGIDYELIITDDGSKNNYFSEIEGFLQKHCKCEYQLLSHEVNQGTVKNFLDAVNHASGEFIRTLGAGDSLYGTESLKNHVEYVEKSGKNWSFGQMLYFSINELGERHFVKHRSRPQLTKPYLKGRDNRCVWNYCVVSDIATGTAILYKKDLLLCYLERFEGKVIYTEDYVTTLMMFDGYLGAYYPAPVVCYEFGDDGITAPGNKDGGSKVYKDINSAYRLLLDSGESRLDHLHKKICKILHKRVSVGRKRSDIFKERGRLWFAIKYRVSPNMTDVPADESCLARVDL